MGRVTIIRVPSLYAGYIFISPASRFVMSRQRYNPSLLPGIKVSNLEKRLNTFNIKKMCAKMLKARKEGIGKSSVSCPLKPSDSAPLC